MTRQRVSLLLLILLSTFLVLVQPEAVQAEVNAPQLTWQNSAGNNLYISDSTGKNPRQLTNSAQISSWEWSPDGVRLAFIAIGSGLNVINADGSGQKVIGKNAVRFSWSPDATALVFQTEGKDSSPEVYVVEADGSGLVKLPSQVVPDFNGIFWSPSSDNLLFAKPTSTSPGLEGFYKRDLYSVNRDGSGLQKLFTFFGQLYGYWPDGQRVFIGETAENEGPGIGITRQLTVRKLDGSSKQTLGEKESVLSDNFRPEPGGKRLLINSYGQTKLVAEIANPAAAKILPVNSQTERVIEADWSNESGKIIAVVGRFGDGAEPIYRLEEFNLNNNSRRLLTTLEVGEIAGAEGSVFVLNADAGGQAFIYCQLCRNQVLYSLNLQTGKLDKLSSFGFNYQWRPNFFVKTRPEFYQIWEQSDAAVALGIAKERSWLWGPQAGAAEIETFAEGVGGKRRVQYFDKARMEVTNPEADRANLFFVTNGLLPKELISGQLQTGLDSFETRQPAEVNVAGDPAGSITYAKLKPYVTLKPGENVATNRVGAAVTALLEKDGTLKDAPAFAGVKLGQFISETGHNIADVFSDYFKTLPQDWLFVMGYPISEPYQTMITLNGKPTPAIIQVFERRVLTYTPSNPNPFKVEQGNVGLHYYQWRYNK